MTTLDDYEKLHIALNQVFLEIVKELHIETILQKLESWLEKR